MKYLMSAAGDEVPMSEAVLELETRILSRLGGRVREFRLTAVDYGWVLRGRAHTDHAKQLAQHAVMGASDLPVVANEIEVGRRERHGEQRDRAIPLSGC